MASVAVQPIVNPRPALKAELSRNPYYIPNLRPLYKDWPEAVNPNYPELKEALAARIDDLYPPERAAALKKGDYALLSSMWWPRANAKRLKTVTFWFLWLFTWDDEIDQSTSELFINLDHANAFRRESFHYARYSLGVPDEETHKFNFDVNVPTNKLIRSLDIIGAELQEVYNKDQIMCFVEEIDYYMDCQQREQARKLTGAMPLADVYWETRMGTSAVTSMLALNE
ncbi:terpenoid synthase [Neofusicoccum parvum]|uniref:Terpene synthase n=1 Tax=Botryosphaeria parva (strain UCR-NP2) TaxID=1287680 RepID=R1EZW7_BOTPV|nr:hypothetical protein UCRNP2_14 [Neofusicoccum parvum UCRNP2]GME65705.1 terpenoid synthase [Neofusicoccum parvum]